MYDLTVGRGERKKKKNSAFGTEGRGYDFISQLAGHGRRERHTHYPVPANIDVSKGARKRMRGDGTFIFPPQGTADEVLGSQSADLGCDPMILSVSCISLS